MRLYELQNHDDNDYNYWQSQQSVEDDVLAKMNDGDRSPLDASDEQQISFSDIYTYPMPLDYYDLDSDRHRERNYHLT